MHCALAPGTDGRFALMMELRVSGSPSNESRYERFAQSTGSLTHAVASSSTAVSEIRKRRMRARYLRVRGAQSPEGSVFQRGGVSYEGSAPPEEYWNVRITTAPRRSLRG